MDRVFDTDLVTLRKKRALRSGSTDADFLMRRAADDLALRLSAVGRRFGRAAVLFSQTAAATEAVLQSGKADEVVRVEQDAAFLADGQGGAQGGMQEIVAAAETVPFEPASLDLAVSLFSLHQVNDVPGMLAQVRRALKPDGLFLAALAGAGTLAELRDSLLAAEMETSGGASPRVAPFLDIRDAGSLLQRAGFALPVSDVEPVRVRYAGMFELMRDLRAMGETSALLARSRRPATRRLFARAAEIYAARHADPDGRIRASFQIVWFSGWAPHPSQQKPLKRGSAAVSLASVLSAKKKG